MFWAAVVAQSYLMPAVARITWYNNFDATFFSDSITSKELKESPSSNQWTTINSSCYLYHMRIEPVVIDNSWNILYAVCLYSAYWELNTLPLLLYYKLLV